MASNSNIFALLLAGLDVDASAAEINKQLNSAEFQSSLDSLKTTLQLDENTFKALEDAMKNANTGAESLKKTLTEAADMFTKLQADQNRAATQKASGAALLSHAQEVLPGIDFTTIKKDIDPISQEIQSLTLEWNKTGDAVYRVKVKIDDLNESGYSMESIRMVETIRKEFKQYELDVAKTTKELEKLKIEESQRGESAGLTERIETANLKLYDSYVKIDEVLQSAQRNSNLTLKEFEDLGGLAETVFKDAETQLVAFDNRLSETKGFKDAEQALSQYKKEYKELGQLLNQEKVEGDKFSKGDKERLQYLKQNTSELKNTMSVYPELIKLADKFTEAQKPSRERDLGLKESKEAANILKELTKEYTKLAKVQHDINMKGLKVGTEAETKALEKQRDVISESVKGLRDRLEAVQTTSSGQQTATEGLIEIEEDYASKVEVNAGKYVDAQRKKAEAVKAFAGEATGITADIDLKTMGKDLDVTNPKFEKLAAQLYKTKTAVKDLKMENDGLGNSYLTMTVTQDTTADRLQHTKVRVHELTGAMTTLDAGTSQNVSRMMGFSEQLGHAVKKMAVWGAAAKLLHGSLQQLKKGLDFVKDLDKDITQAAIVTGKQRSEVKHLASEYANLALEMGKTVKEISAVNTALLRQGLSIEESGRRLDTITKLSAAGQISTENSLHIVTAAVNAMQESHVTASDVMLKASNISASSVEQLGEAFTKTASSAYATGMSIQETTGILATMLEVTQEGPSQLGTSLKTILARFTRVNEETGEFNAELNKVQAAVESVGISFLTADGQIRNVYDILQDLSGVWKTLDKNQQAYIATTSAGVRMQNRFFALMNNFEKVQSITEQTGEAAGTTEKAFTTYLDSVEAASNRTKASLEQLWINTINPDDVKMMYDFATSIIRTIDKIGGLSVAVVLVTAALLAKFGALKMLNGSIAKYIGTQIAMATATANTTVITELFNAAVLKASGGLLATAGAFAATAAAAVALGLAIVAVVRHFQKQKAAAEANTKALHDLNETYADNAQNAKYNRAELQRLGEEYSILTNKIERSGLTAKQALNPEEFERFVSVQEEMLNIYPELITETDRYGNSFIVLTDGVSSIIAQYDEFIDVTAENFKEKHEEMIETVIGDLREYETAMARVNMIKAEPVMGGSTIDGRGTITNIAQLEEQKKLYADIYAEAEKQTVKYATSIKKSIEIYIAANRAQLDDYQVYMLRTQASIDQAIDTGFEGTAMINYFKELTDASSRFKPLGDLINNAASETGSLNKQLDSGTITYANYVSEMNIVIKKHRELIKAKIDLMKADIAREQEAGGDTSQMVMALEVLEESYHKVTNAQQSQAEASEYATAKWNDQAEAIKNSQAGMDKITSVLDKMKDGYHQTAAGIAEINAISPDLLDFIHDEVLLREKLIEKHQEQEDASREAYGNMLEQSESYYHDVLLNDTNFINLMQKNHIKGFEDFKSLAEAKFAVEKALVIKLAELWADFYKVASDTGEILETMGQGGRLNSRGENFAQSGGLSIVKDLLAKKNEFDDFLYSVTAAKFTPPTRSSTDGPGAKETKAANDLLKQQQAEYKLIGDLLDAQIRKIKASNDKLEEGLVALRKQIADVDTSTIEGLQEKYRLTEELVAQESVYVESLKTEQDLAHEKANTLREMAPHLDTTKWFDANNEATEAYVLQLANADENSRALIEFLFGNLQKLKNLWGENADEVKRVIDVQKDLAKEMTNLIKLQEELNAKLREEARVKWIADQNKLYSEQQKRLSDLAQIQEVIVGIIRKRGEEEKRALDENHNAEMKSLDERHNERKKKWAEETDLFKKMIQDKIDALDEQHNEEDYLEELQKERDKANELQKQIDVLSLDDSLTARNKVIELRKQLADQNEVIAKKQQKKERDVLKKSLQDQIKDHEKDVKDKESIADKTYENEKKRLEEDYKINKEFLDRKYSDEQVYAEARDSIEKNAVEVTKGRIVSVQTAYEEFEDRFGKGMGYLGDVIKKDFLDKLAQAQKAIRDLEYTADKWLPQYDSDDDPGDDALGWKDPPRDKPSSGDGGSSGGIYMSREDFSQYRAYKMLYEAAQRSNDRATMDETHRLANAIRKKYGISGDKYSFSDLQGKSHNDVRFKSGGLTDKTGIHILDGEPGKPERVLSQQQTKSYDKFVFEDMPKLQDMLKTFDSSNFQDLIKSAVLSRVSIPAFNTSNISPRQGITLQIDNFIKADNITKDSIPELRKVQANAMEDLKNLLNKNGVRPSLI